MTEPNKRSLVNPKRKMAAQPLSRGRLGWPHWSHTSATKDSSSWRFLRAVFERLLRSRRSQCNFLIANLDKSDTDSTSHFLGGIISLPCTNNQFVSVLTIYLHPNPAESSIKSIINWVITQHISIA